ncbi:hypothetical protein ACNOYE_18575 [Nannocystaceae bacterium ST9]
MSTDQANVWLVAREGDRATLQIAAYNRDTPIFFVSKSYLLQAISQDHSGTFEDWYYDRFDEVDEDEFAEAEESASRYVDELRVEVPRNATVTERFASHWVFERSGENAAAPAVNGDDQMHPISGDENDEDGPCRRLRALPADVPWTLVHVRCEDPTLLAALERIVTLDTLVCGPMIVG